MTDTEQLEALRYPIGKYKGAEDLTVDLVSEQVQALADLPGLLRVSVKDLTDTQLDTPYRPGGWTVRQVVHHVADSHMNSYVRCRLALTEDNPVIKPYEEQLWAQLPDARQEPVDVSLVLLEALHHRWVALLKSLTPLEWKSTFLHPESGINSLLKVVSFYAWHGRHHLAHITNLRQEQKW